MWMCGAYLVEERVAGPALLLPAPPAGLHGLRQRHHLAQLGHKKGGNPEGKLSSRSVSVQDMCVKQRGDSIVREYRGEDR
jgi:hypothetical protein